MLHRILKLLIGISIRLYYRKIKIINRQNLVPQGPTIVVANHPNTIMDAWMIGYACKQPVYFMAKATLFNSPWKLRLLRALKMIPINRAGEGAMTGVSNASSFEKCYAVLEEGKTLVIFPEGTSFLERQLRDLKPGAARIALEVEKRGMTHVHIVPVGINYMRAEKFRSRVYLEVGKPIAAQKFVPEKSDQYNQAARKLTEKMRVALEHVLVTMENTEEEQLVERVAAILQSRYRQTDHSKGDMIGLKLIRNRIDELKLYEAYKIEEIEGWVAKIDWKLNQLKVKADFLDRNFRSKMFLRQLFFSILFLFIGLPLFLFGWLHNYLPYRLTDLLIPKISSEIEYYAPLAVLLGMVLYPVWYGVLIYSMYTIFLSNLELIFCFIFFPISGIYAYFFWDYLRHVGHKWSFVFMSQDKGRQLDEVKEMREKLKNAFR